jgi:hypothetical protein
VNRLVLSLIGVLAGVGLAVAVGAVLFLVPGPGPEHPSPVPTGSDGGTQGPGEPVPSELPEPDDGAGGPRDPRTTLERPPSDEGQPFAGHVVTGGPQTHAYEAPSTGSEIVATVPDGAAVYIVCTTRGEAVPSPLTGVSSDVWDYTTLGGYVPDVVVDTGSDEPVRPECSF